jgi:hypothetical protein
MATAGGVVTFTLAEEEASCHTTPPCIHVPALQAGGTVPLRVQVIILSPLAPHPNTSVLTIALCSAVHPCAVGAAAPLLIICVRRMGAATRVAAHPTPAAAHVALRHDDFQRRRCRRMDWRRPLRTCAAGAIPAPKPQ